MNKKGIYRGDIYFADLSDISMKNHPIVVVSNWKLNSKKDRITVAIISSQMEKYIDKNVVIDEVGLIKESKITVETLHTIEKSKLLYKVGVLGTKALLELDDKLRNTLELQDKAYNVDTNELENLFVETMQNLDEDVKVELQHLKIELWNSYKSKNYEDAIYSYEMLKEKALKCRLMNKREYLYYAYYMGSLAYIKMENFEMGLDLAKQSLACVGNPNELNNDYANSMWAIARCYEGQNEKTKSIKIYESLVRYYERNNDINMQSACMFNIAKLNESLEQMIEVKNTLEKVVYSDERYFDKKNFREQFLTEMDDEISDFENRL